VPQGRGIFPDLTALENLRMALLADGGAAASLKDRLRWWRSRLLDRRGGDSCSGGKRVSEALGCSGDGEPSWTRSPARGV